MPTSTSFDSEPPSASALPVVHCIHHLFEHQATRTPDNIALEFEGRCLTYRQLDERANQWAWRLRELGVGPETLVGLCVERSLEMVIAIYAVLKAGGAYVPLDPHLPVSRLALILDDSAPAVLITQHSLVSRCADFQGPRFWVDDDDTSALPVVSPAVPVTARHAAYVIYTSGSTGRPKGALIEHRAVVNFTRSACARSGLCGRDAVLSVITVSFDMSVFDWFAPLSLGARLIVAADSLRSEGSALAGKIRECGATVMRATPSIWKSLLQAGWPGRAGFKAMSGGEALPPDLARLLLCRCGELWNCYGPTETTAFALATRIENPDDITIGTPLAGISIRIVDEHLRPVPPGADGELLIGGPSLARGYLNRPELTAERFIPDPFSNTPEARLYRTGDLCQLRPDGKIAYIGRIDTQIKLHGFRIELGEIETDLRAIDGVRDAAVSVRSLPSGEKYLIAFLVAATGQPLPSKAVLRASLSRQLPGYMVPAQFAAIERLPLTPNGKLDRLALAAAPAEESAAPVIHVPTFAEPSFCLHHRFERQAALTPDALAVVFHGSSLTYGELNRRADLLAARLHHLGVGPDVLVGLWLEPSLELLVGLLGILKAGGAYLPIDRACPPERAAFMLADARVAALVAHAPTASLAPAGLPAVLIDQEDTAEPEDQSFIPLSISVSPDHLAYVIYTSGTTGRPKGVMITHRNVERLFTRTAHWFAFNEHDVWTLFHSIAFDFSVWEIWGAWLHGGRLVIVDPMVRRTPAAFRQLLAFEKVTVLSQTPSAFVQLIAADEQTPSVPLPLRFIVFGGEALDMPVLRPWVDRHGDDRPRLINMYGITETTVHVTYRRILRSDLDAASVIGEPIPDLEIHLLDTDLRPVPAGTEGEICVGGSGLARGYLHRPELNAERFIAHPFDSAPGARLYRSGDLARRRPDGDLEYLGRIDHQVKIRGHRVELGEIETALAAHPAVRQAVVLVSRDAADANRLTAFLVAPDAPATGDLRQWLLRTLPDYMVPARFIALPEFPLTPNGKVDRTALAKTGAAGQSPSASPRPATGSSVGQAVLDVWSEVLEQDQISARDNFFDLGGHSLLAVVICSQLSRQLGTQVRVRSLFDHPVVADFVRHLETRIAPAQTDDAIPPAERDRPLTMSFAQQGMWLLDQLHPDPAAYNVFRVIRVRGPLDRPRLLRTLQAVMARHEILRTSLGQHDGQPVQLIAAPGTIPVPWIEPPAPSPSPADPLTSARAILTDELRRRFHLEKAPHWRTVLVPLAENDHLLAFIFHHGIMDEWALRLFAGDCSALYAADGFLDQAGLPALPIHYGDYSVWQRRRLNDENLARLQAYWSSRLADIPPPLDLPCARPRQSPPKGQGSEFAFRLDSNLAHRLRQLARAEGTTAFTVMLAAFHVWLGRVTGQDDVVVSTPMTQRSKPELLNLLGFFINTVPIRARLSGDRTFQDTVRDLGVITAEAFDHADLPFEQIVSLALQGREPGPYPLHQIMFVLVEETLSDWSLPPARTEGFPLPATTSKNDLTLFIEAGEGSWDCRFEYATDLLDNETISRFAGQFTQLLRSAVGAPAIPVNRLNLLPEPEYLQVTEAWNRTASPYPRDRCIHELFEDQVALTPDAAALLLGNASLTYRELNDHACRIAAHLHDLGVVPGSFVALRVERSFARIAAVLGILKAGGAYWALEDNLPESRLRLMLADARPAAILVHAATLAAWPADLPPACAVESLLTSPAPSDSPPAIASHPGQPAYINYTSGSTGQPKGVLVPHRGVVRLVRGCDYVSLTTQDTLLHHSPLSFDASTLEIWGALLNGGRIALAPPSQPSLTDLGDAILRHKVTTLWLTAGLFHLMVDENIAALKPLRQLLAGGDVLSPEHMRKARLALPDCRLVNGYGPTENTTFTCCHVIGGEVTSSDRIPIGRPVANTTVYILDRQIQPVPVGATGELYTGGDGVALGYLNQPQLTAERFIPDPFSLVPGARLYRTGDAARWLPDGQVDFLGRLDSQVKIRGFRIELGEIESVFRSLSGVRAAAVLCRPHPSGGKRLVAYLVSESASPDDALRFKADVAAQLPDYMVPDAVCFVPSIPLTPNGKIDQRSLPDPVVAPALGPASEPPRPGLETTLAQIWCRLFQRTGIGRDDNFFDLGGHSLLATRLSLEIEKATGRRLPISALFKVPTLASLARFIHTGDADSTFSSLVPLQPKGNLPALFCIHGWGGDAYGFIHLARELAPDRPVYGLQAIGLDGQQPRQTSAEQMAVHYAGEIRKQQPHGPYRLLGYSLGGWLAYAVAQELLRQGERIAFLAALDTTANTRLPLSIYLRYEAPAKIAFLFKHRRVYLRRIFYAFIGKYFRPRTRKVTPSASLPAPVPNASLRVPRPSDYYRDVVALYHPPVYPGNFDLFIGEDAVPAKRGFWKHYIRGRITLHQVAGTHHQLIFPPNISTFAEKLRRALRQADSAPRP